jgi:hypothetical protein
MKACQRCEHSKAMIDLLTRQCWEMEAELKQKKSELEKASKLEQSKGKEDHPMKKIEDSLLHERGEAIKRLKAEVEELREENEFLYREL